MFPKRGNAFPSPATKKVSPSAYRAAIAGALKADLRDTHQAIKIARRWTGASERTVKNWFAAKNSLGGEQLIILLGHSDGVLDAVLRLGNRHIAIGPSRLVAARSALFDSLQQIDSILEE
jgi:hypothetical protein